MATQSFKCCVAVSIGGMVAGAVAAAVVGNAGPQVAVPEEIVTVPASALVGGIVGAIGFLVN